MNSIRNKFHEISPVLTDQSVDIMAIGESNWMVLSPMHNSEFQIIDSIIKTGMESKKNGKYIFIYIPPKMRAKFIYDFMHSLCETFAADDELCIFMGDMSCNMLVKYSNLWQLWP